MKKYLLSISLIFLSPTINAMNKSIKKSENLRSELDHRRKLRDDIRKLESYNRKLQEEFRKSLYKLQEEIWKNLCQKNYTQVSQLLEDNEDFEPTKIFSTYERENLSGDNLAYYIYKAAHEASHKRPIQILAKNKQLVYASVTASKYKDEVIRNEIKKHPLYSTQLKEHIKECLRDCNVQYNGMMLQEFIREFDAYN